MNLNIVFIDFKNRSRLKIVLKQGELNMRGFTQKIILPIFVTFSVATLSSCGGGGGEDDSKNSVVIEGDKPIAYVERNSNTTGNPTDAAICSAGGKLYIRKLSSVSSSKRDITSHLTNGQGDVSDLEVSYDGTKILFAMKLNCSSGTWNIYEFDNTKPVSGSNPSRIITDDTVANLGNDVDPAYVPRDSGDLIVFSSNRQTRSKELMRLNNIEPYSYRDEYERERVSVLHTMNENGTGIRQISFNQSHDRNATVLSTGEIMYSRWDHVGGRNQFSIFTTNPDGTNMFVFYGAHSPGNSFLHPRQMPDNKTVVSSLMPLSRTREGGAIMLIKANDCSENNDCDSSVSGSAQSHATSKALNFGRGLSQYGRATDPYPLYDGTNRLLVSWAASCAAIDIEKCPKELNLATNTEEATEGTPQYGIYMLNIDTKNLDIIDIGSAGKVLRSPVALIARAKPNGIADKTLDPILAAKNNGMGILNVKSVYDTDSRGRMGSAALMTGESIPQLNGVPDLAAMKDPTNANYKTRPARFIRITKAVPTPSGMGQDDMGETMFEMQEIVGYTEIEPDGSFKVEVPADTPLAITALDSEGRAFQVHTNWIQVKPGETRTCNGCHSSRRGSAINVNPIAGSHPNTLMTGSGNETMAETRFNSGVPADYADLKTNLIHSDVWATVAGQKTADITIDYTGLATPPTTTGVVNYTENVAPIWTAIRTNNTGADIIAGNVTILDTANYSCTTCHNDSTQDDETDPVFQRTAGLDLSNTTGGEGYVKSYSELMVGDPILDANGLPTITIKSDGDIEIERERAPVSIASSRSSILMAVLYNQALKAGARQITKSGVLTDEDIASISINHSSMTNASERRVINEWIDLGGQYYNTAFIATAGDAGSTGGTKLMQSELRTPPSGLSESVFNASVHPILMARCAQCHQAFGGNGATGAANQLFTGRNRFVLTGNQEGDYNITTTMVTDVTSPATSNLLTKPTSTNAAIHSQISDGAGGTQAVMSISESDYTVISNWITSTP